MENRIYLLIKHKSCLLGCDKRHWAIIFWVMGIKVYDHYDSAFLRHYLIKEYIMDYGGHITVR